MAQAKERPYETGKLIKLTADRQMRTAEFKNEHWEVVDSEDSYIQLCTPFYNFIYEEIEKTRNGIT